MTSSALSTLSSYSSQRLPARHIVRFALCPYFLVHIRNAIPPSVLLAIGLSISSITYMYSFIHIYVFIMLYICLYLLYTRIHVYDIIGIHLRAVRLRAADTNNKKEGQPPGCELSHLWLPPITLALLHLITGVHPPAIIDYHTAA